MSPFADFDSTTAEFQAPGEDFAALAERAADAGLTHVVVTTDPPPATWLDDSPGTPRSRTGRRDAEAPADAGTGGDQFDEEATGDRRAGRGATTDPPEEFRYDPYPAWFRRKLGLLKVARPDAIEPYVTEAWADWADDAIEMLDERTAVLEDLGLRAVYATTEPQVLPEPVFAANPAWRGPRVDQPNRSRKPHFAPCVDNEAVLDMYREATATLLERYPAIDRFEFKTTDAGSGLCWADSLYPGRSGNAACRDRTMAERVTGFLDALRDGAERTGTQVDCNLAEIPPQRWMADTFDDPDAIARSLDDGWAINGREGPAATPFDATAGETNWEGSLTYPVLGIPQAVQAARSLQAATAADAPRLTLGVPPSDDDLSCDIYARAAEDPPRDRADAFALLRDVAADRVGEDHASTLLSLWTAVDDAIRVGQTVPGHPPNMVGGVHQRWLTRPLVPFPLELDADDRRYYRQYLFQARSEADAENLVDCQGMKLFEGWAARLLTTFAFDRIDGHVARATDLAGDLASALDGDAADRYRRLERRLEVWDCVLTNSRHAIDYQAGMDLARGDASDPDPRPPLGAQSSWLREFVLNTARAELDNTARLRDLLFEADGPVLFTAPTEAEAGPRRLEPHVVDSLERKLAIMNDRWDDYRRLFTQPNP